MEELKNRKEDVSLSCGSTGLRQSRLRALGEGASPAPPVPRAQQWAAPAPRASHVPHVSVRRPRAPRWGITARGHAGPRAGAARAAPAPRGGNGSEPRPQPGSVRRVPRYLLSPRKGWTVLFWKEQACCQVVLNGVSSQSHLPLHIA